jgi:hypothetical protein
MHDVETRAEVARERHGAHDGLIGEFPELESDDDSA